MNINGNPTESTFEEINTDNITSIDSSANIELGNNSIDLQATNILVNGAPIAGGVENPLTSDLIGNGFEIQNIGKITINQNVPFVDVL